MAIALDLPDIGPTLRGDRALLVQMMANLIENAVHHAKGASRIGITVRKAEDRVTLVVQDDGIGIPQARSRPCFVACTGSIPPDRVRARGLAFQWRARSLVFTVATLLRKACHNVPGSRSGCGRDRDELSLAGDPDRLKERVRRSF